MRDDRTGGAFGGLDPLRALLAIEEIRQLRSRYFEVLDARDWPGYAALFTEAAVLDFREEIQHQLRDPAARAALPEGAFVFTGGQAAADTFAGHLAGCVTVHHGHDHQVTLTGADTATGVCAMWDCLDYGHELFQGYGHYRERYRRVDGRWLIEHLRLTRSRTVWQPVEHRWRQTAQ
jgi:hypothetical protein